MIRIDTSRARARLALTLMSLSKQQIATAQRLALNDAARWGKTQIGRDIRGRYNIPLSRINDKDPKRGLRVQPANVASQDAKITGGHRPVNIATLTNTKLIGKIQNRKRVFSSPKIMKLRAAGVLVSSFSAAANVAKEGGKEGYRQRFNEAFQKTRQEALFVSAEVVKGERKTIQSAFVLGVTKGSKGAAFTGEKAAIFARGSWGKPQFAFSKKRSPIATLHTVSIATAALHSNVQRNWMPKIKQRSEMELKRQVERMLKEAANQ